MMSEKPHIKNTDQYKALRYQKVSREKAAHIANTDDIDHHNKPYEERSRKEFYDLSKKIGTDKRSKTNKGVPTEVLREQQKICTESRNRSGVEYHDFL